MRQWLEPVVFASVLLLASSCGKEDPIQPVSGGEERIKTELEDRSFRQFDPSKDAGRRKAVVLDFFDGITLWAQYSEEGRAIDEWEVSAKDYRIEQAGNEIKIQFNEPASRRLFPDQCEDCIPTAAGKRRSEIRTLKESCKGT